MAELKSAQSTSVAFKNPDLNPIVNLFGWLEQEFL